MALQKAMAGAGLAALLWGGSACGTTIFAEKDSGYAGLSMKVWYECHTNTDYPVGHPCRDVVEAYQAERAAQLAASRVSKEEQMSAKLSMGEMRAYMEELRRERAVTGEAKPKEPGEPTRIRMSKWDYLP